jgi:imidazolonepropionase-like amidohydrolase
MTGSSAARPLLLRGGCVLDVATGATKVEDIGIRDGIVVRAADLSDPTVVDAAGRTICFGLWDCHAHPGGLMYDRDARGYFEGEADRAVRAGTNLAAAAAMGITGVRALGEVNGVDLAWARTFRAGLAPGPRVMSAGQAIRVTGGHGTAYPRKHVRVQAELICDGPVEMTRGVRQLAERGVDWVKVMLSGGLYSEHEAVDGGQLTDEELQAVVATATAKALPVAAHCGSARAAARFATLGGRSVEHGYALDEESSAAMADAGTWLVPTIGVTHDVELMERDGWPAHARARAAAVAGGHADAVRACLEAGVRLATGADLNPIGPRLHAELRMLERAGLDRLTILRAATAGGRELNGLGCETAPRPGSAADLLLLAGDPLEDPGVLARPAAVIVFGRLLPPAVNTVASFPALRDGADRG